MSGGWPGLPPIDIGGWGDWQRKRLQQEAAERIASVGAVASDWGSAAQRRIEEITGGIGAGLASASAGLPGGAAWNADLERIRSGAAASEAQFPPPQEAIGSGPSGFVNQTGTPEGEAITAQLAQTAMEQTPGGSLFTDLARKATGAPGPMTADSPLQNMATMGGLALQNVGAPLPGRWAGRAINPGVLQDTAARAVAEAVPGGQTSVFEGAPLPGGQTLTKDTPVLGGLTTPDEAIPLAAGGFDAEDIVGAGNRVLGPADDAAGLARRAAGAVPDWAQSALDRIARYGTPPQEAMGVRAGRPPTGPSAPGAGMTPDELQQRVRDAEEAIHLWQGEQTPEYDYVARLLRAGQEGEVLPEGTTDWNALIGSGRVDPDALNRALIGYREEGLSKPAALARAIGSAEERAANLQVGAAGVRDPSGLTPGLLNKAIADLAQNGRPFVTQSEGGAFKAGRNEPPNPAGKKNAWEYVDKNGRSQWLSTPYEVLFAKQLDANPDVAYWMQSSPEAVMETTVRHGGSPKVFTPDFIVVGTDGRIQVVEIKNIGAYRQVPWRVPEKLREAEQFFNSKGVGFSIFVEDQLGRVAAGKARPEDFLPDANGRSGVVNGFYVESEEGSKVGRFDADAARGELAKRLREAGGAWDTNELGYLSGYSPVTQAEYDELLTSERWPEWSKRLERGRIGRPDRRMALITPDQRKKIQAAGVGGTNPAEGGYGRPYEFASPPLPEQGGYDPRWTAHRAYAEFNERQRRKGAPSIATDAVETYPLMRQRLPAVHEEWGKQVADGQHGMSIDPLSGTFGVPGRYAVSVYPDIGLEFKGKFDQIHPDRLAMFMAEAAPILRRVPQARVGVWYDSSDDITYLDLSVGVDSLERAKDLGQRMSQKAIFDSVAKKDIGLRYEGYALGEVPPPPPRQEQDNAISAFTQRAARPQPRGAAVPGAAPLRGAGAPDGPAGPAGSGGPGSLRGGVAGAGPPGYAGADGPDGEGLGGLEPGGMGSAAADAPFGTYPPPVPYAGAAGQSAAGAGGPGEASDLGIAAGRDGGAGDWRSALDAALASVQPYGAARTGGERSFDLATGTAGGVLGAATADEDATWQERAGRFAAGATGASLLGPTARGGLGLAARNADTLGAAAGRGSGAPTTRGPGALSRVPELLSAIPLAAPTSLVANLTGGMARTVERVAGVAAEGRPIDAMVDLGAMAKSLIGGKAARSGWGAFKAGPTEANPGMTGAMAPDDLLASKNWLAKGATGGVRANAATDQFWRELNEAGARAQAGRRGLAKGDADAYATRAGDFATFTGSNSVVAKKLTEMKQTVRDPNASGFDRGLAAAVTSMAPYVMMPERLLRATIGSLIPVESATGMVRAYMKGDKAAAREMRGRTIASLLATSGLTYLYFKGGITGDRPEDANEARRREARGEQWNTIQTPTGRYPTRFFGSLGMQANAIATTLDAARRTKEKGGDPGAVLENGFNGAARWMLDASYLSDLSEFGADVQGPEGAAGAIRNVAAGLPSRLTGPITGPIGAGDEYEREAENFPEQVMMRTGLRSQLPARIDPTTGEAQRRRGSGWERYWGTRGSEQTPEGSELARLRVTPRVIGRTEEYLGAVRSREDRRKVQQVLGSETARTVRRTMNATYYKNAKDIDKKGYLEDAIREAAKASEAKLWKMGIRKVGKAAKDAEEAAELESAF